MNKQRMHTPWHTWLTGFVALALILTACGPTPTTAPPTATAVPPTAAPTPTAEPVVKPQIVIAYDSDIDHIGAQHFRTIGAYDATANLYEPLITQVLVANDKGQLIGQRQFEGAGAESYEVSSDGTVFTFHLR